MSKNPFDLSDLFKSFNPEAMSKMFDPANMMSAFKDMGKDLPDMTSAIDTNKRQFEAMAEANKAAAASYKDMVEKQAEIFQDVIEPAQKMMSGASDPATAKAASDAMNTAVEQALGIMQQMADTARTANEQVFAAAKDQAASAVKNATKS